MTPEEYSQAQLILPFKGANDGLLFPDISTLNNTAVPNGLAKTVTSDSKYYDSCASFDGTNSYVSVESNENLLLQNLDFTLGVWVKFLGYPANDNGYYRATLFCKDVLGGREWIFSVGGPTSNTLSQILFEGLSAPTVYEDVLITVTEIPLNTWTFVSCCRFGNLIFIGVDGTIVNPGGTSFTVNIQQTTTPVKIGGCAYGSGYDYYLNGLMQDAFMLVGQALWTADFTPPGKLLANITSATQPENRIVHAVPRSYPSRTFSAEPDVVTGQYSIDVPNVECTVNIIQPDGSALNDLTHRFKIEDNPLNTGYEKSSILLPMNGADQGTVFTDWSPAMISPSRSGNPRTVTAISKYYGSSGYFDGSSHLIIGNTPLRFLTDDFTIAFWINLLTNTVTYPYILTSSSYNANDGFYMICDGSNTGWGGAGTLTFNPATTLGASGGLSAGTVRNVGWTHIAVVRFNGIGMMFANGVLKSSKDYTGVNFTGNGGYVCTNTNTDGSAGTGREKCYLQDLIVCKGHALWTADFTPPTQMLIQASGTVTDVYNDPAERTIVAVPRSNPTRAWSTLSDEVTGAYSLDVPNTELSLIAQDSGPNLKPDIISRVVPA